MSPRLARLAGIWTIGTPIDQEIRDLMPAGMIQAENALAAAGVEAVAVIIHRACGQYEKPDPDQFEAFMDATIGAFKDIPLDLVELAAKTVVRTWRGRSIPSTGFWMDTIIGQLRDREALLRRLRLIEWSVARDAARDAAPDPYAIARNFVGSADPLAVRARAEGFDDDLERHVREAGNTAPSENVIRQWKLPRGTIPPGKDVSPPGDRLATVHGTARSPSQGLKHVAETLPAFRAAQKKWDEEHGFNPDQSQ